MTNRRFEMNHYRHILVRMRQGESDRQIAAIGLMGRRAAGQLRKRAEELGWLDAAHRNMSMKIGHMGSKFSDYMAGSLMASRV